MKALNLLLVSLLSFFLNSFANDTLVYKTFEFKKFDSNLNLLDFKLDTVEDLFLKDILFNSTVSPVASTGNIASPIFVLTPLSFFHSGYELLPNYYENYFFKGDEIFYLNKAITSLKFSLGSKREQNISFFHSQNFGKRINIFARSQNFRSDGFYRNQTSKSNCFELGFSSFTKNSKIFTHALISVSKINNRENGGVVDTLFPNEVNIEKNLLDVNLLQASNRFRRNTLKVTNKYCFKNIANYFSDSIVSKFNVYHSLIFEEVKRNYLDSLADDFYGRGNYSVVSSTDFIYNRKIENNFGVYYSLNKNYLNVWLSNPIHYVSTYFERMQNNGIDFNIDGAQKLNFVLLKFKGKYFINNYNKGDYFINWRAIKLSKNEKFLFGLSADVTKSSPYLFYNNFYSNRNLWNNNFNKESFVRLGFNSTYKNKLSLDFDYFSLKNLIYFNEFNKPIQVENDLIKYLKLNISANLKLKKIVSNSALIFQRPLSNTVDLNFPSLFLVEKFRFQFNSFKKNLSSGVGIDASYSSAANGWRYLPSISVFTLNNNFSAFSYPRIDFVYDFKVRNLEGFVRVDNVLSGIKNDLFFTLEGYPMPDRTIRLCLIWTFIDNRFIEKKG